ncbi:hypothetical protein DFH27DRAFT_653609 [Peziza echinospora]|nr:hypothetical protein DFH27DRAFT_653609 [Peziza echinospora]
MPSLTTITRALVLALACTAASVIASPVAEIETAESKMHGAIAEAKDLGIDLDGPIPNDFTVYDEKLNRYEFEAGSKASAWARAQIALTSLPGVREPAKKLDKRGSGVALGMWHGTWCSGSGWYIPDVLYDVSYVSSAPYISVGIGSRSLGPWEQLDFSRANTCPTGNCDPNLCGVYLYSAGTYTPPGCWNSGNYNCAHLWLK